MSIITDGATVFSDDVTDEATDGATVFSDEVIDEATDGITDVTDEVMDNQSVTESPNKTTNPSVTSANQSVAQSLAHQLRPELELALRDLQEKGESLAPSLHGSIEFILGWDDYNNNKIENAIPKASEAIAHYNQSNIYKH